MRYNKDISVLHSSSSSLPFGARLAVGTAKTLVTSMSYSTVMGKEQHRYQALVQASPVLGRQDTHMSVHLYSLATT